MTSKGKCYLCNKAFSKGGMTRHLKACLEKSEMPQKKGRKGEGSLHVQVEGRHLPDYWMHLEVPAGITLAELDQILRDIWLECCGHLSAFYIHEETYNVHPNSEFGDRSMKYKLAKVVGEGEYFTYDYDFGSTTELTLRLVGRTNRYLPRTEFSILARNNPPQYPCDCCDGITTYICPECIYDNKGLLCEACSAEHECGEDMLLPMANSPRAGVCAYEGSEYDEEQ